jgi:hypothetical protein
MNVQIHGRLPGDLEEIRYHRTSDYPGFYKHAFTTPTDIFALTDGGLLIRPRGGSMRKLWLDNPRRHGHRHHHRHHRHNPFLAAYNPGITAVLKSYASVPYMTAALSGGAGFAVTFLSYKALFSLTALGTYGVDQTWTGILVRLLGRIGVAAVGGAVLSRFLPGHNRMAYIGGATAYVGLATALEAGGYQVTIGAAGGAPLVSVLPTSLQPATAVAGVDGVDAYMQRRSRPRGVRGTSAFLTMRGGGMGLHPSRLYTNRLSPS